MSVRKIDAPYPCWESSSEKDSIEILQRIYANKRNSTNVKKRKAKAFIYAFIFRLLNIVFNIFFAIFVVMTLTSMYKFVEKLLGIGFLAVVGNLTEDRSIEFWTNSGVVFLINVFGWLLIAFLGRIISKLRTKNYMYKHSIL